MTDLDTWRPLLTDNVIRINPDPDAADKAQLRRETGFSLLLPLPPSENALYANSARQGRVKTPKYRAWIKEAGLLLNRQLTIAFDVPVEIHIIIRPDQTKAGLPKLNRDGQGIDKALLDLISGGTRHGHGLIPDDSMKWIKYRTARVVEHDDIDNAIPPGWCRVVVKPMETDNG